MKTRFLAGIALILLLCACENNPVRSSYHPLLPELPERWEEILGEPHWRLEWVGEGGVWLQREISPGQFSPDISIIDEWATPALAWPFWPERQLLPGMVRPAGALFPWDVRGKNLVLSWEGGVDAFFWKKLAVAERPPSMTQTEARRLPWYFDWPRFRELFAGENIPETIREDPWLADWESIAQRTVQSGFDRRRIAPRRFTELAIPGMGGRWIGSSPFAPPVDAPAHDPLILNVADTPDTWVSSGGVLKGSSAGWVWRQTQ